MLAAEFHLQGIRDEAQHLVAGEMPLAVVQLMQPVRIDIQADELIPRAFERFQIAFIAVAVRQSRQYVDICLLLGICKGCTDFPDQPERVEQDNDRH